MIKVQTKEKLNAKKTKQKVKTYDNGLTGPLKQEVTADGN